MTHKLITLIGAGVALAASAVWADDTPGFVGHTIHASTPGFGDLAFAMAPDGHFTRQDGAKGTWTFDGNILCYHTAGEEDLCGPFDGSKKPGDHWQDTAWDGNGMADITITEGLAFETD